MNAAQYQHEAVRTLVTSDGLPDNLTGSQFMVLWCALGLAGETGEFVDLIKKHLLHRHVMAHAKVIEEAGDVLWYLTNLLTLYDIQLEEVFEFNAQKLRDRYPEGFQYGGGNREE